jgi:thiol-disulfide isomerase/thioredoxin
MKNSVWAKAKTAILFLGLIFVFAQIFSAELHAQKRRRAASRTAKRKVTPKTSPVNLNLPKVTQIDTAALQNLLKREGENAKPLLINFWATWCDPCREEFPDLIKIDADYKGKIDFITISLDYLSEINGDVPKFLAQMKAEMPAYLLKTDNEGEAIALVSKTWEGGLPFTILFDAGGKETYQRQGKIKPQTVRAEIDKLLVPVAENKNQTKTETKPDESEFFNKKPLEDFGAKYGASILKKEIDLNASFEIEVTGKLDESGKLVNPALVVKPGSDEKMTELAKQAVLAFSDSQLLKSLYDLGGRNIKIMFAQNQTALQVIIYTETDTENKAKASASMLRFYLKNLKLKEGSNEAILMSNAEVSSQGKNLVINLLIPNGEKNQMIRKSLETTPERQKTSNFYENFTLI